MLNPSPHAPHPEALPHWATATHDTVETRLWQEEHEWLYALLRRSDNCAPTFRIPDLFNACVALALGRPRGA